MSNIDLVRKAAEESRGGYTRRLESRSFKEPKIKRRKIDIKLGKIKAKGQNVDVYKPAKLDELYGRKNLCLKVFRNHKEKWGRDDVLGVSGIVESSMVQNLVALQGLAPRVYDIVQINGKTAQVTDWLTGKQGAVHLDVEGISFHKVETKKAHNFIDGKLVDFQGARFVDFAEYRRKTMEGAMNRTSYPRTERRLYQSTDYMEGKRDTRARLKQYGFTNLKGKSVLDIGCNLGMMTRAAYDLGAKRAVGFDWPDLVNHSVKVAILDGYWNIDLYGADLRKYTWNNIVRDGGIEHYDVLMFLAMKQSLGMPKWLKNCDTLVYEGHGLDREFFVKEKGEVIRQGTISGTR